MAQSCPLPPDRVLTRKALSGVDQPEQIGARIIHLSDYGVGQGKAMDHDLRPSGLDHHSRKLQAKAVRFFQGQQELNLTNKG